MFVELGTRAAIVIAVIVPVPADAEAEPLGARHGRRRDRDGRQRSENARKLSHFASPIVVAREENVSRRATFLEPARNFLEHPFSQVASSSRDRLGATLLRALSVWINQPI
jgi:hypothetical protein